VVVDVVAEVISAVQTPIKASGTCQQLRNSLGFRLDWVKSCFDGYGQIGLCQHRQNLCLL